MKKTNKANEIKILLKTKERTPAWLSRKLGISTTMVYYWLDGKRAFSKKSFDECQKAILGD